MLIQRVLTAAVILPLFLAALFYLPRSLWGLVMLGVVAAACAEWGRLAALPRPASHLFGASVLASCLALGALPATAAAAAVLVAAAGFWLVVAPLWMRSSRPAAPGSLAVAGWLVLVASWLALYLMHETPGRLLALLAVIWLADSAAYFAGRKYGRRKLAPTISPGKTWEGVAGAVVVVGVYYAVLWLVVAPQFLAANRALEFVLVMCMVALGIEGDLFESWMKRRAGVKDSGALLPGHGGVLDRIDGLLAALPFAALAWVLVRG